MVLPSRRIAVPMVGEDAVSSEGACSDVGHGMEKDAISPTRRALAGRRVAERSKGPPREDW